MGQPQSIHAIDRRLLHQALPANQRQNALVNRGSQVLGLFIGFGHHHGDAQHHIRLVQRGRWFEVVAVNADGFVHVARCEVRGEGVGHAAHPGQLGAEQAGAQQPHGYVGVMPRYGDHFLIIGAWAEVARQLLDIVREVVRATGAVAAQGVSRHLVGTWCTAQAQVDSPGVQAGQGAELLGDYQWRVVGQHHST